MRKAMMAVMVTFAMGCGIGPSSPVVGGECENDRDCQNMCSMEKDFGTGMCTQRCETDQNCPEGSVCVERDGGLCAVSCEQAADCDGFGRAFTCKNAKRVTGGDTQICRLP